MGAVSVIPHAYASTDAASTPDKPTSVDESVISRTVTLVTGDRVTVRSGGSAPGTTTVQGPDGEPVGAHVTSMGADTYVYPDSAMPYLGRGLIDKRLFNVTRLLREGYGDAERLPLILTYKNDAAAKRSGAVPEGSREVRSLDSVRGKAVTEDLGRADDFWSALTGHQAADAGSRSESASPSFAQGVAKVWLDSKIEADLADTVAQVGAPSVWAEGNTGEGVDVAVLDTGVDAQHPDLDGRIETSASFVPGQAVTDRHGHGTHVAATVAGTGAASQGKEKGVAPGADLHVGKVLNDSGSGYDSWLLAGMEWAAKDQRAKIISMSIGGDPTDGTDLLSQAVNTLSEETGALFVVAAGNNGPNASSVESPGAADAALTVGAVNGEDQIALFSSRGPRLVDHALKPEITAPGVDVLAARSQYSPGEGHYTTMSGTSMATPHVAGAAALLAAEHPDWTGQQLKDALVSTAKSTPELGPYDGGSGRLDIAATTKAPVVATGTAYLGIHPRNNKLSGAAERQVTYTNTSGTDITLDLALDAPGVPHGLITLSSDRVTVPAGGTETVTVAADLSTTSDKGLYTGVIEATGPGGQVLADTVVGVSTEDQPHHLVIKVTGRNGEPVPASITVIRENDPAGVAYPFQTGSGTADVLVPEGTYAVWAWGVVEGAHGPSSRGVGLLAAPKVVVDTDTTVTLDGTALREVKAVTPKESVDARLRMDYHRSLGDTASVTDAYTVPMAFDSMWAKPGDRVDGDEMSVTARWRKIQPELSVESGSQSFDDLWLLPGSARLPEGSRHVAAVFAGTGTAADYSGLDAKGKVAVVRRGNLDKQVTAAEKAGVKLLLIVNGEPGRYFDGVSRTPVTVATLTKDLGEHLISQVSKGGVSLRVTSHPTTDYLYDLVRHWNGRVPDNLTYRPQQRQLARVDVDFRRRSGETALDSRFDITPHRHTKVGNAPIEVTQRFRTDWVTADDSVRWMTEVFTPEVIQWGASIAYPAGSTHREQWFGPIQRPRLNDSIDLPQRSDAGFIFSVPGWGDSGADHAGIAVPGQLDQTLALYQGNTLVAETPGGYLETQTKLRPELLPYRLVATTERDPAFYPYSTRTRTTWQFVSGSGEQGRTARLPLLQLDYALDTDLEHKAARSAKVTLLPSHLPAATNAGTVRSAGLWVSYDDGATWREQRLKKTGHGWETQLRAPAGAKHVTLRAQARDSRGNSVEQTVIRAFGLR
ncbi:hypothetical protein DN051_43460 (plasmid) [Streptomyces cadmiisoli]|uniref:Peptidase S8/S53 domain-containing protein n=1 Tax=Streptomyces cadmiisoli TaxID=2184053 RepID=A0A2Z4JF59_9ACTN|nr:hypothetical protein DN051_43460 [Streptomyces cadmiisoli]